MVGESGGDVAALPEFNRFNWPGPDLRPRTGGDTATVEYGDLAAALFAEIQKRIAKARGKKRPGR